MGNPDWSCRDDGSDSNCNLDLCDNRVLNEHGDEARQAYYVLESVNLPHSYFEGVSESFMRSGLDAALSKDNWAKTVYEEDSDNDAALALKEVLNGLAAVVGTAAAITSFAGAGSHSPREPIRWLRTSLMVSLLRCYRLVPRYPNCPRPRQRRHANGWTNPGEKGALWEGIFSIPMCDVGCAKDSDFHKKEYILQPYGHESRPVWYGPICENDQQKNVDFLESVQMGNLQIPRYLFLVDPGY